MACSSGVKLGSGLNCLLQFKFYSILPLPEWASGNLFFMPQHPPMPAPPTLATDCAKMTLNPPHFVGLTLCLFLALMPVRSPAQSAATAPSQTPAAKPSPGTSPQKYTDEQVQEMIAKLQDRIHAATDQVMGRIQKEETDLYIKFTYFLKPNRLDPNTYSSKEDIALWQQSLRELRDKEAALEKLYAEADQDLGNALVQQKINPAIAEQVKNELLKTFPWGTIRKKNQLMQEFIAEHGDLLAFYDKNWGAWKPGTATFGDQKLTAAYKSLKERIINTGLQIEGEYKTMLQ